MRRCNPPHRVACCSSLTNPYVITLIIIVILLIIIGMIVKKRRDAVPLSSKPIKIKTRPVESVDWEKEEKAGLKDVTATPATGMRGNSGAAAAMGTAALGVTTTLKLDDADPMAEADFHMAYGLYDQAADVLKKVLRQNPGRTDIKKKLLEVYFTAGDRANFVEAARDLHQETGALTEKEWEKIAIMGRQVAADDPLFSDDSSASAALSTVDIPLGSVGTGSVARADLDPLAGAFDGVRSVTVSTTSIPGRTADDHAMDFSLPDLEPTVTKSKAAPKAGGAEFDLGELAMEPVPGAAKKKAAKVGESTVTADFGTDSQVEFDKALKELSDFVNTNVPPQEEATRSGAAMGAPLSLAADADAVSTNTGTGEETTGLNEIGTKLDFTRAYIDMGDADGAKSILEEVLQEGDSKQKQEAQKLMQHLA